MYWIETQELSILAESDTKRLSLLIKKEHPEYESNLSGRKIHLMPTKDDIRNIICSKEPAVVLSPEEPSSLFGASHPFSHIRIKGDNFPFKQAELDMNFNKIKVLEERFGISVIETTKTLSDLPGSNELKEDLQKMIELESLGIASLSAIFTFGVSGSGKTYMAECLAGETGRVFVVLDLPHYMSQPNPTRALEDTFLHMQKNRDIKWLILIDEIEKMFDFGSDVSSAKQIFGKLLTWLNFIYNDPENNIAFITTANDVSKIMKYSPEFIRKGRFNRLYFLGYPKNESAVEIFNYYKDKNLKMIKQNFTKNYEKFRKGEIIKGRFEHLTQFFGDIQEGKLTINEMVDIFYLDFNIERNISYIEQKYSGHNISGKGRFIYNPPEIKAVCEELQYEALRKSGITRGTQKQNAKEAEDAVSLLEDNPVFTQDIVSTIVPLQMSAKEGVRRQISQSVNYLSKDTSISMFFEA